MSTLESEGFEADKLKVKRLLGRQHKRALERVEKQREILNGCREWGAVAHEATLLQSNLFKVKRGANSIEVEDWLKGGKLRTIELEPRVEPHLLVAKLFKKSKKLRAGIPYAERQLERVEADLASHEKKMGELEMIVDPQALEIFCSQNALEIEEGGKGTKKGSCIPLTPPKMIEPPKPYHQFTSETGVPIWVGKNAKNNDALTFQCANGSDFWLHAHNYPGSHVVIRAGKGQEPDSNTIADAAELALRYSKAKDLREGEVTLSQVKFLRRVSGAPGKVMVSKHKALRVVMDQQRWLRLKEKVKKS